MRCEIIAIGTELLLGQINSKSTDDQIKQTLRLAFKSVETGWMESIDDSLAKKARLSLEIPEVRVVKMLFLCCVLFFGYVVLQCFLPVGH